MVAACGALPVADAAAARSYGSRPLHKPMRGQDVRVLQQLLTDWGLPTDVDGTFGRHTKLRVRSWERNSGRRIDGRVSRADAIALKTAVDRGERLPGSEPEPEPLGRHAGRRTGRGGDDRARRPRGRARLGARAGQGDHRGRERDPRHAVQVRRRATARWKDSGYDCSGSMSYAFHGAGMLDQALDSTGFMSWGDAGKGQWVTTYANSGHSFMVVAGLRFDTSGRADAGSRWQTDMRSRKGYTVRHPPGL